jgi:hypothetical protein
MGNGGAWGISEEAEPGNGGAGGIVPAGNGGAGGMEEAVGSAPPAEKLAVFSENSPVESTLIDVSSSERASVFNGTPSFEEGGEK